MSDYSEIVKEETLKALVYEDFFKNLKFGYEPNIDNIDFVITDSASRDDLLIPRRHLLWAEAKRGADDTASMLTQLVLTFRKTYVKGEHVPPPYIGCFDAIKFAFVPFRDILPLFSQTDINWNITPSNHDSPDFLKLRKKVLELVVKNLIEFRFDIERREIKDFVRTSLSSDHPSARILITLDNFVHIYNKWVKEVKPKINISRKEWQDFRKDGVLDCDFYRADIMSHDGSSISDKLKIILAQDKYKLQVTLAGRLFSHEIGFIDGGVTYGQFWNKYQRPPVEDHQKAIIDRRDLLVPQNIREIKGSYFTPQVWVRKSQEYLDATFGQGWQSEYYIWDCAAGTGNLLAGLTNKYNIYASTLDEPDVDSMKALLGESEDRVFNLLEDHIFQFDFLNDKFEKLPQSLRDIIADPEKRSRLIVYINPPYAEAGNKQTIVKSGDNKSKVSASRVFDKFEKYLGTAMLELFAQFIVRVQDDIPGCKLAMFSKLKHITSANFGKFREYFRAGYRGGFVCKASTFDNVVGQFPIGFLIWDLEQKDPITAVQTDVFEMNEKQPSGYKEFRVVQKGEFSVDWLRGYFDPNGDRIGYLRLHQNDIQNKAAVFITSRPSERDFVKHEAVAVTSGNLVPMAIYCAIRQAIEATWLNDRDQFLFPIDEWKTDSEFHSNCLVAVLFDNDISAANGVNHWIPFSESEVGARERFKSGFMSDFLKGYSLSPEASATMDAGRSLWMYYHQSTKGNKTADVDASFYDIREYFQGRNSAGRMNLQSSDDEYTERLSKLRNQTKILLKKIESKVYQYRFLRH